ncbi:MAG: NUDIX domain-containing protein [Parvibaculum sp.]
MSKEQEKPLIPSATIMLVRDGAEGLEVFMVVRHHQIDFASGALVFPGGKLDEGDTAAGIRARCDGPASNDGALALQVAAIREAFEECGVLLARPRGGESFIDAGRLAELEPWRDHLHKGKVDMLTFLEEHDLHLACDALIPFAHWITPTIMPKRFDTHFYVAVAPSDHLALHDGHESVDSVWIRPSVALADAEAKRRTVIFPTRMNIEKLGRAVDTKEALTRARESAVVTVLPEMRDVDGVKMLCIPAEADYCVVAERLENIN